MTPARLGRSDLRRPPVSVTAYGLTLPVPAGPLLVLERRASAPLRWWWVALDPCGHLCGFVGGFVDGSPACCTCRRIAGHHCRVCAARRAR